MPQEPESVDKKRPSPGLFSSQHGDYKRLFREYKTFQIELDLLEKRTSKNKEPWLAAAKAQLKQVDSFLGNGKKKRDNEGGWVCLHAAKRHAIYGLEDNELSLQASILRKEATKIVGWRADAIKEQLQLLDKDDHLTPARIINAMSLRDEYFSNQYHKIWMVGDQLRLLIVICGVGLILLVPLVFFSSKPPCGTLSPWSYQMVGAVFFFGLLGASFSAAGSLMDSNSNLKIPERVANQFVTSARALFGAGAGIAGYAFLQSKLLNISVGDGIGPGSAIAVAFLFGFTGEKLIANVLGALGAQK